jgi:hypothetical protein
MELPEINIFKKKKTHLKGHFSICFRHMLGCYSYVNIPSYIVRRNIPTTYKVIYSVTDDAK